MYVMDGEHISEVFTVSSPRFLELKHAVISALMYPPGLDVNNHKAWVIFQIFIRLSAKSKSNYTLQLIIADLHLQITLKSNNDFRVVCVKVLLHCEEPRFYFLFFLFVLFFGSCPELLAWPCLCCPSHSYLAPDNQQQLPPPQPMPEPQQAMLDRRITSSAHFFLPIYNTYKWEEIPAWKWWRLHLDVRDELNLRSMELFAFPTCVVAAGPSSVCN